VRLEQEMVEIPLAGEANSLAWDGDDLVDFARLWRIRPDGSTDGPLWSAGFPFDRAVCTRMGGTLWSAIYQNRGTKAVLMKNGQCHRELNRSFDCAVDYDHAVAITEVQGRAVVIYCPDNSRGLALEDAETGERLGVNATEKMEYHSRLTLSPDRSYLLSAGWFWHPVSALYLCSLPKGQESFAEPNEEVDFCWSTDVDGAAFLGEDRVVVSTADTAISGRTLENELAPRQLGVWSIPEKRWTSVADLDEFTGTIMPWRDWVISFYGHPKAIELATGKVVHRWENAVSGKQVGAIDLGDPPPPPMALDSEHGRFAVAGATGITVVKLRAVEGLF